MKIDRITAQIKLSRDTGNGWKSIEIGAEATVDEREGWATALSQLYTELGRELKTLWANGNGHKAPESHQNGSESTVEPLQPAEQPDGQWFSPLPAARRTLPGILPWE